MFIVEREIGSNKSCLSCADLCTSRTEVHKGICQVDLRIKNGPVLQNKGLIEELWIKIGCPGNRCDDCWIELALCDSDRSGIRLGSIPGCLGRGTVRLCDID